MNLKDRLDLLICLTDLHDWHYMLIESSANKKMVVKGYQHIEGLHTEQGTQGTTLSVSLPLSRLQKHTNFLIDSFNRNGTID